MAILANVSNNGNPADSGITLGTDDYASLLTANGGEWEIVQKINNVLDGSGGTKTFNTDHSVKSRFWMVAMANEQLGEISNWAGYNDHAKISMIGGISKPPSTGGGHPAVPEPTTWLLMSVGLLGLVSRRRHLKS